MLPAAQLWAVDACIAVVPPVCVFQASGWAGGAPCVDIWMLARSVVERTAPRVAGVAVIASAVASMEHMSAILRKLQCGWSWRPVSALERSASV